MFVQYVKRCKAMDAHLKLNQIYEVIFQTEDYFQLNLKKDSYGFEKGYFKEVNEKISNLLYKKD